MVIYQQPRHNVVPIVLPCRSTVEQSDESTPIRYSEEMRQSRIPSDIVHLPLPSEYARTRSRPCVPATECAVL